MVVAVEVVVAMVVDTRRRVEAADTKVVGIQITVDTAVTEYRHG
jgi:hypothetical protein